jgi:hypothetical protein
MAWRCGNCNRIFPGPDPEAAIECCQPEVSEVSEGDTETCPECNGTGALNETPTDCEECPYCLGTGTALKPGVYKSLPGTEP